MEEAQVCTYFLPITFRYFDIGMTFAGMRVNKQSIAKRLQWIISSRPEANPSRATLKRVNEYLLTPPDLRRRISGGHNTDRIADQREDL